jgi:hypothetical protein
MGSVRRLLRPLKRSLERAFGIKRPNPDALDGSGKDYWEVRKNYRYFTDVVRLARQHAGNAQSVLDVGPRDTPFVRELAWIPAKTALDLQFMPMIVGATNLQGDFLQYQPERPFDLVLCLQVLEHLDDPTTFARKLLATGKTVIISVPYRWPLGTCKWHPQDPIDEEKLLGWMGRPFIDKSIVTDQGAQRIIGVFHGDAYARPPKTGRSGQLAP